MIIKGIRMYNFRQYMDVSLEFSTDPEKNITLVMGDNGTGKTTLAQAFTWCLFGTTDFEMQEVINRKVRDKLPPGGKNKTVVEMNVNYNDIDYTISREQVFTKIQKRVEASKSKLKIYYKENGNLQYLNETEVHLMIKRMLPKELSRFFFFDGERIRLMSDEINHGKSKDFKDAVSGLVGLVSMQNAIQHMKPSTSASTVIGYYNKKIDVQGGENVKKYSAEIERLTNEKEKIEKRLEEIEPQIESYREEITQLNAIIIAETPEMELKEKYKKLQTKLTGYENRRKEKINIGVLSKFGKNFYDFVASVAIDKAEPLLNDIKEADVEIPVGIEAPSLKYLLKRGTCICGEKLEPGDPHFKAITDLLEVVPPKTTGKMVTELKEKNKIVKKQADGFYEKFSQQISELRALESEIENIDMEATNIFNSLSDTSEGEKARAKIASCKSELKRLETEQINKKASLENIEKDIHRQKVERDKLVNVNKENEKYLRYLMYARYIYDAFEKSYKNLEERTRYRLEKKINEIFPQIYDGGMSIEVDNKYNIKVLVDDADLIGDEIEKNTAQSYSVIFAFITSIIAMAKEKVVEDENMTPEEKEIFSEAEGYPLVMDAPLSNFDKTRIKQICTIIPSIAKQVVFFIKDTDGEIAEQHMLDKIGKKYVISLVDGSKTNSTIKEVE